MSKPTLGIIGGGQLGSMLASAANKLSVKTVIFCNDVDAPAQKFSDDFVCGKYNYQNKIFTFDENLTIISAISDNPQISLAYKIIHNL